MAYGLRYSKFLPHRPRRDLKLGYLLVHTGIQSCRVAVLSSATIQWGRPFTQTESSLNHLLQSLWSVKKDCILLLTLTCSACSVDLFLRFSWNGLTGKLGIVSSHWSQISATPKKSKNLCMYEALISKL